jgi:hypothetical protein
MFELAKRNVTTRIVDYLNLSPRPPTSSEPPAPPKSPAPSGCSIASLPNELLYQIAIFIPADSMTVLEGCVPDRFQLLLVSKRVNEACTPLLYEHVCLDSYQKLLAFYRSGGVLRDSHHTISLTIASKALFGRCELPPGITWPQILFPLNKMRALQKLVIHRSGGMCSNSNLEHPVLTHLVSCATNPAFLPSLTTLEVPYYPGLFTLCRGRPVANVKLGPNITPVSSELFDKYILELGKTTASLKTLAIYMPTGGGTDQTAAKICQVTKLCSGLRVLELRLPKDFSYKFEVLVY